MSDETSLGMRTDDPWLDRAAIPENVLLQMEKLDWQPAAGVSYDYAAFFPKTAGWGAAGDIKRKLKLMTSVEPYVAKALFDGEQVKYVAKGVQYAFGERFFLGIWARSINHTVFVLTNLRLIMIRCNRNGLPKDTAWSIYHSEIAKFQSTWSGNVSLKLVDGSKQVFQEFKRLDRKRMPTVFEETVAVFREKDFHPPVSQSKENLCGICLQTVPKGQYECSACGTTFWTPQELAMRSLLLPALGDIAMRHWVLMTVELIGYTFTVIFAAVSIVEGLRNGDSVQMAVGFIALIVAHVLDAALTYGIASKGLHIRDRGEEVEFVE